MKYRIWLAGMLVIGLTSGIMAAPKNSGRKAARETQKATYALLEAMRLDDLVKLAVPAMTNELVSKDKSLDRYYNIISRFCQGELSSNNMKPGLAVIIRKNFSDEECKALQEFFQGKTGRQLSKEMIDNARSKSKKGTTIPELNFTEAAKELKEAEEVEDFFKTPAGKKLVDKTPLLNQELVQVMRARLSARAKVLETMIYEDGRRSKTQTSIHR